MISNKEQCQQEKTAVFQGLLQAVNLHGRLWMGINGSTSLDVFFQLVLPVDQLAPWHLTKVQTQKLQQSLRKQMLGD